MPTPKDPPKADHGKLLPLDLAEIQFDPAFVNIRGANEGELLGDRAQLRESIRVEGQRVPLLIRAVDRGSDTSFYLCDGFRRYACLKELAAGGWIDADGKVAPADQRFNEASCLVRYGTQLDALIWNSVSGYNEPVAPYAMAERIVELFKGGMRNAEISTRLSQNLRTVQVALSCVTSLAPTVRQAARERKISYLLAKELAKQESHEVQEQLLAAAIAATTDLGGEDPVSETKASRAACAAVRARLDELVKKGEAEGKGEKAPKKTAEEPAETESEEGESHSPSTVPALGTKATDVPPGKAVDAPTEVDLRARLDAAYKVAESLVDADPLDLLHSLQSRTTTKDGEPLSAEAAAIEGYRDGWCDAVAYLLGEKCDDCETVMIKLPKGKHGGFPQEHKCKKPKEGSRS